MQISDSIIKLRVSALLEFALLATVGAILIHEGKRRQSEPAPI
jgi:hypothetical protein